MPRGLSFAQIGVTESLIGTYADAIWGMSNNIQIRRGDPIRRLEFERVSAERADLGMSDGQIAAVLGLTRDQVMVIRVLTEVRRFRRRSYYELYELGRGKRFHPERHVPLEARSGFRQDALALRDALRFDPRQVGRFIAEGWWGADTLPGWLAARAAAMPLRLAVRNTSGDLDYATLHACVERMAEGLHALGIGRGDVVTVQLPNTPEFLIAYFAIARIGAVMSTARMPCREAELRTLLAHGRARALICLSRTKDYQPAAAALGLKTWLPALEHVIALGEPVGGARAFVEVGAGGSRLPDDLAPAPADPFLLLFTSGAGANPKAVPLTSQATLGNARLGAPEHGITADDVLLSAAPYTHIFGLYSLHLAASVGAANLMQPALMPQDFAQAIADGKPTVLFASPAHFAALLKAGLLDSSDLSSVRLVICSGSACPPELARAVATKLPNGCFSQLWGTTEMQAGLYTRPDDPVEVATFTVGRPSPGAEVRVVGPGDAALPPGTEGELQVRGSLMFPGYYGNEEANARAFTADGWFRSGDQASLDAGGNVRITGLSKGILNRGSVK